MTDCTCLAYEDFGQWEVSTAFPMIKDRGEMTLDYPGGHNVTPLEKGDSKGQGQGGDGTTEAEVRVMAKSSREPRIQEAFRNWKRQGNTFFQSLQKEDSPADPFQTSQLQRRKILNTCCFKPLNL